MRAHDLCERDSSLVFKIICEIVRSIRWLIHASTRWHADLIDPRDGFGRLLLARWLNVATAVTDPRMRIFTSGCIGKWHERRLLREQTFGARISFSKYRICDSRGCTKHPPHLRRGCTLHMHVYVCVCLCTCVRHMHAERRSLRACVSIQKRNTRTRVFAGPQLSIPRANIYVVVINQLSCLW